METKFTKGKWEITDARHDVVNCNNLIIALVYDGVNRFTQMEDKNKVIANAKLIAAAPELLNACINSAKTLISIGVTMEADIMIELENAIKKATE